MREEITTILMGYGRDAVGSGKGKYYVPQPSTSSHGWTIVIRHTRRDQVRIEQLIVETPQNANNDLVDHVQQIPEIVEQPVEQHIPQGTVSSMASKAEETLSKLKGVGDGIRSPDHPTTLPSSAYASDVSPSHA
ncbi:hypothetical protein ACH5RR_009971 [Cinchona calisaya]|uniref:Uncharacterized protein n=1 Tax=Cinchona calisaya TaxID=153742 RepID=A0ABD3AG94_9GENT